MSITFLNFFLILSLFFGILTDITKQKEVTGVKRMVWAILACLLLCGCSWQNTASQSIFAMDTVMQVQIWSSDPKDAESAVGAVESLLRKLEGTWSAVDPNSKLSMLNRGEDPRWTAEEAALLTKLDALQQWTGGAFDPTLGSLSALWGFYDDTHRVPTDSEIAEAQAQKKYDLGAALKGYAGRIAVAELEKLNVSCGLLNLGGNVQTFRSKQDGTPWKIGIQNPRGSGTVGVLSVTGTTAVITSGDYQRYFEQDGVRYHHILDPETGRPADSGLASVTVICADGLKADVLSTALFVMGLDAARDFWQTEADFEAVFILENGDIYATEGCSLSDCNYEVIRREK